MYGEAFVSLIIISPWLHLIDIGLEQNTSPCIAGTEMIEISYGINWFDHRQFI